MADWQDVLAQASQSSDSLCQPNKLKIATELTWLTVAMVIPLKSTKIKQT